MLKLATGDQAAIAEGRLMAAKKVTAALELQL